MDARIVVGRDRNLPQQCGPLRLGNMGKTDPQLVDPHTYPDRPWPLSTITRYHTDYYMRKSFTLLQNRLNPTTVFFLGDLFDGGREWMRPGSANVDRRWRSYGEDFWVKEYKRFGNIFLNQWLRKEAEGQGTNSHRKILAGLPGNHDLGLGNGIRIPVRQRFNAFFGEGNQIDVIGNHTFVSLDTVSLSAKGQPDPATGRQGAADGDGSNSEIWSPVDEFLKDIKEKKRRAIDRAVRHQNSRIENSLLFHEVLDIQDPLIGKSVHTAFTPKADMPTILLTHVPLYRAAGTPCGPLRERHPPSTKPGPDGEYLDNDPPNAIKVEAGIQYQNVLTPEISNEIIEKVGDVEYAFSGDDHDYCEVVHRGYTSPKGGGVREITVKSFSWAMGVRRPGFLMLSLWNPLDREDRDASPHSSHSSKSGASGGDKDHDDHQTIQPHLCLLPDQLSIFIRYAVLLALTLLILFIRAIRSATSNSHHHNSPKTTQQQQQHATNNRTLLPSSSSYIKTKTKSDNTPPPSPSPSPSSSAAHKIPHTHHPSLHTTTNNNNTNGSGSNNLAPRSSSSSSSAAARPRTANALVNPNLMYDDPLDEHWSEEGLGTKGSDARIGRRGRRRGDWVRRWGGDVVVVGVVVGGWWVYCVVGW
ncbi:MAG: hypothetical protein Q9219_003681 [cf. Caloplaca sp. 3 TL-2023]